MFWLLFLFTQQTLAPHPINFDREVVEIEGHYYQIDFDNCKVSLEEKFPRKNRIKFLMDILYRKPKEPVDNNFDRGCLWGCGIVITGGIIFWGSIIYLIWRDV